ncbi:MAG TPA: cytochrome c peroxidase [Chitinophagaceae bacterium]
MVSKKYFVVAAMTVVVFVAVVSFKKANDPASYISNYYERLDKFRQSQLQLLAVIEKADLHSPGAVETIKKQLQAARNHLKELDFWFRYIEQIVYKKINGPLPVEWETEVFEKFEQPYKREGAGLTLAALYLEEENANKDSLAHFIQASVDAVKTFSADSITSEFKSYHNFYLCNRLFLLNLAAVYTTGFECPDTSQVIPELRLMLEAVDYIYTSFNESFPAVSLPQGYRELYRDAVRFVNNQPAAYSLFDHFSFIRDYINPLFLFNQKLINQYAVVSKSLVDYSLNKKEISIFNKSLYNAQNAKGIFIRVFDEEALAEIDRLGKLLFYDPILSGNNQRSCASCHKPTEYFTDTTVNSSNRFDKQGLLSRNSPSLLNANYNHLLMLDGKLISLQEQAKEVIKSPLELNCSEKEVMDKVLSCSDYKNGFKALLKYTPQEKEISFDHIVSAITYYYSKFSRYYSPFDEAINEKKNLDADVKNGFNLFMSKAQCATCHFVPQFNGVKPPYTGSEFEVLGVPGDTTFRSLGNDEGRYIVNPAVEMLHAFRTGTIRNAAHTAPYMHNGVFGTINQVIDFYDAGGGAGKGLRINNQTLSADSLKLTKEEKINLVAFIKSLDEKIPFESPPLQLPVSKNKELNMRKAGGEY